MATPQAMPMHPEGTFPTLADVCSIDLIAVELFECGASVGFKLKRAGLLRHVPADSICAAACLAFSLKRSEARPVSAAQMPMLYVLDMCVDCPDEVLVALLPRGACLDSLLRAACVRNHFAIAQLLLERGGGVHQVEERRGQRSSVVDMARRGASVDGDWRLTLRLLRLGAKAEDVQGALFAPLRCGDLGLARALVGLGVVPGSEGLASLLCDVCGHGATASAAFLLDELRAPVNGRSHRGDACTDRAIAWRCWDTAEWLISRAGVPAKPHAALAGLLDVMASGAARAASVGGMGGVGRAVLGAVGATRTLKALRASGAVSAEDLLTVGVQRGDVALVEELLPGPGLSQEGLVDLALCHGHLRIAGLLLRHGFCARHPQQATSDALSCTGPRLCLREVLDLLRASAALELAEAFLPCPIGEDPAPRELCDEPRRTGGCFVPPQGAASEADRHADE